MKLNVIIVFADKCIIFMELNESFLESSSCCYQTIEKRNLIKKVIDVLCVKNKKRFSSKWIKLLPIVYLPVSPPVNTSTCTILCGKGLSCECVFQNNKNIINWCFFRDITKKRWHLLIVVCGRVENQIAWLHFLKS